MKGENMATSFFILFLLSFLGLSTFAQIIPQPGSKENDRINGLPGQPRNFEFGQYSGSIVVNNTLGSALFYYLIEAPGGSKNNKPLLLWLNGGPLASSLMGLMEIGPCRVGSDGETLFENIHSWNKVANLLFLETPVGVGFSYCNTTSELQLNDDAKTTEMNYVFLLNWLERFPEYKHRDFYIAGESYAGNYIPLLSQLIVQRNKPGNDTINLKGILMGNPTIDPVSETFATQEFFGEHSMISLSTFEKMKELCIGKDSPPEEECGNLFGLAMVEKGIGHLISTSNVLAPLCNITINTITDKPKPFSIDNVDPCILNYLTVYLNSAEVRQALHAPTFNSEWGVNPDPDAVVYLSNEASMLPIIKDLLTHNIRVLIYSGDLDARIPTSATIRAIQKLNIAEKMAWKPWTIVEGDAIAVGGYAVVYESGLTFSTVRGAGHEVPEYQPARSFALVSSFLAGKERPS